MTFGRPSHWSLAVHLRPGRTTFIWDWEFADAVRTYLCGYVMPWVYRP